MNKLYVLAFSFTITAIDHQSIHIKYTGLLDHISNCSKKILYIFLYTLFYLYIFIYLLHNVSSRSPDTLPLFGSPIR